MTYTEAKQAHVDAQSKLTAARDALAQAEQQAAEYAALADKLDAAMATAMADGAYVDDVEASRARTRATAAMKAITVCAQRLATADRAEQAARRALDTTRWPARRELDGRLAAEILHLTRQLAEARALRIQNANAAAREGCQFGVESPAFHTLSGETERIYAEHMLRADGTWGIEGIGLDGVGYLSYDDCIKRLSSS